MAFLKFAPKLTCWLIALVASVQLATAQESMPASLEPLVPPDVSPVVPDPGPFPILASHPLYPPSIFPTRERLSGLFPAPFHHPTESDGGGFDANHLTTRETQSKWTKPTSHITVQIQSDFAWFDQNEASLAAVGAIPDGAFFRRARIGAFGELYKTVEYRAEFDFAGQARPRFLDNWIALTDIPLIRNIIVGHFFEPFSLERYTPNRFITFMERSLADTFAPARNMGLMTYGNALDKRVTWGVGVFRSMSNDYGEDVSFDQGWATTAHATALPWFSEPNEYERYLLHVGASYSYRRTGDNDLRFSTQPSVRLSQQGVGGVPPSWTPDSSNPIGINCWAWNRPGSTSRSACRGNGSSRR
jgi:hypothetical protein